MTLGCTSAFPLSIIVQSADCYSEIDQQRDVFESHRHHVFSVAYYMTGDEREAEAILGSTFIQAFKQSAKPTVDTLDQALMGELHSRLSLAPVPVMHANGASLGGRNVRRTDLEEALWQLPARERLCFLLRDVEGYTSSRIAGLLESSDTEVQRTILSARIRVRSLLIEQRSAAMA